MAVNSPPASLLIDSGKPNVSNSPRSFLATPTASLNSRGYANRNLVARSTTISRYLFPALDTCFMSWRSISRTSQGHSNRAGIMATRWLRAIFLLLHPHDSTYSLTSWATVGHPYLPLISRRVRATPGWPQVLCTSASTPGTSARGMASSVPPLEVRSTVGRYRLERSSPSLPVSVCHLFLAICPKWSQVARPPVDVASVVAYHEALPLPDHGRKRSRVFRVFHARCSPPQLGLRFGLWLHVLRRLNWR